MRLLSFIICLLLWATNSFAQPDIKVFKSAFDAISGKFKNSFEVLKGDEIANNSASLITNYTIKSDNLPGTFNNHISDFSIYADDIPPVLYAQIDSNATASSRITQMERWKAFLIKVFPEEAKQLIEKGTTAPSDTHAFIFTHPLDANSISWKLTLSTTYYSSYVIEITIEEK